MQDPAQRALGHLLPGGQRQAEQGHRPVHGGEAEVLGRAVQEDLQQVLVVLVQERGPSPARFVGQRGGVSFLGVDLDPVVNALAGRPEHARDVGSGTAAVELQDGQGAPEEAGITRFHELAPQAAPLPRRQVQPAHGLVLPHPCCPRDTSMSNLFWPTA